MTYSLEAEMYLSLSWAALVVVMPVNNTDDGYPEGNWSTIAAMQARKDIVIELLKYLMIQTEWMEHVISQLSLQIIFIMKSNWKHFEIFSKSMKCQVFIGSTYGTAQM